MKIPDDISRKVQVITNISGKVGTIWPVLMVKEIIHIMINRIVASDEVFSTLQPLLVQLPSQFATKTGGGGVQADRRAGQ